MKDHTDFEIRKKLDELWPDADWDRHQSSIEHSGATVRIRLTQMYGDDRPELTFEKRLALSQFFDTMNVETEDEISEGGCETCDYGSSYGFIALIRPGDPFVDLSR